MNVMQYLHTLMTQLDSWLLANLRRLDQNAELSTSKTAACGKKGRNL